MCDLSRLTWCHFAYTAYLRMKKQVFGKKASVAEADNDVAMSIF